MVLPLSVIVTKRAVSSERVALPLLASCQARTLGVRGKQARRLHANEDFEVTRICMAEDLSTYIG